MSAGSALRSEYDFLCSICLDVFTDPISTPCGHNFCKHCITTHWDMTAPSQCPMCKETFHTRPLLRVNTFISEMVAQFRAQQKSSRSEQQVSCDLCTGTKVTALKSCLECLASFCETHLEPHLTIPGMKIHQLIDPVDNLEDKMCPKHKKPLELFCKTDHTCVCIYCTALDHKNHEVVPLEDESDGRKAELRKTEAEFQQMIKTRRMKIEEFKCSVKISKDEADREKAKGVQVFTVLKAFVDKGLNQLEKEIEDKQMKTEKQAEDSVKELEQEIFELMKRSTEVEKLCLSGDHLQLLQCFPPLKAAPSTKEWTRVRVSPPSHEGTVVRALSRLEETLREELEEVMETELKKVKEAELKKVQQFEVDVTLDPDTANQWLVLSADGKQVYCGNVKKNLQNNPERFSVSFCVLGKQSFSSGRFYFEVQVKGKTEWTLGVAGESINRKRVICIRPVLGLWAIWLRKGNEYEASDPVVGLSLRSRPDRVGVFVDHEQGVVSFYDVDAAALIFSYTACSFTEKLLPYFNPRPNYGGKNSAPLMICAVNQTP